MVRCMGVKLVELLIVAAIIGLLALLSWTVFHRIFVQSEESAAEVITAEANQLIKDIYLEQVPHEYPPVDVMPHGLTEWVNPANLSTAEELEELIDQHCREFNGTAISEIPKFYCSYEPGLFSMSLVKGSGSTEPPGPCPGGCDDGNICTTDSCDSESGCQHVPIVCPPDSDPKTVDDCVSSPPTGCGHRPCRYDLYYDGVIGGGDFGLFAGCYGRAFVCNPPAYRSGSDPCCVSNFDESPDGFVGPGDFSGFAGCYAMPIGDCKTC